MEDVPQMVLRVAQAIGTTRFPQPWEEIPEIGRKVLLREARVAVEAMREPNKKMLKAACRALSPGRRPVPERVSSKVKYEIRWKAMVDAALGLDASESDAEFLELAMQESRNADIRHMAVL